MYGPVHNDLVLIAYAQKPLINDHVTLTNVSDHLNSPGHSVQDFSFILIDKVSNNLKRLLKETTWMHVLGTISPKGMHSKVLFN